MICMSSAKEINMEEKEYELERELFYALTEKKGIEGLRSAKFACLLAGLLVERGVLTKADVVALLDEAIR